MVDQKPNGFIPFLILVLTAIGLPTAAAFAFAGQVTNHPFLALLLAFLYEIGVVLVTFLTDVGNRIRGRQVDRAADLLEGVFLRLFVRYYRPYCKYLNAQCGDFEELAVNLPVTFSLPLNEVFVPPTVAFLGQSVPSAQEAGQMVPENRPEQGHSVWKYVTPEAIKKGGHWAIIGAPGTGKTALLKYVTLSLIAGKRHRWQLNAPARLPILLFLKAYTQEIPALSLAEIVHETMKKRGKEAPPEWFEKKLSQKACLILLDGLDEAGDESRRREVVNWVEDQMRRYPGNPFIVTSRPHGWFPNPISGGVDRLEVQPFDEEQREQFARNWYLTTETKLGQGKRSEDIRRTAQDGAKSLLEWIKTSEALQEQAKNPLLLTMIALVHKYGRRDITSARMAQLKVALYEEICRHFLRQEGRPEHGADLSASAKQSVLASLAYDMLSASPRLVRIPVDQARQFVASPLASLHASMKLEGATFLEMVKVTSSLLLERESGFYEFAHLTLQEYLAAVHIRNRHLEQKLIEQIRNPDWHETILLYAAQSDASPIIEACLVSGHPTADELVLAIECAEDGQHVQPATREKLKHVRIIVMKDTNDPNWQGTMNALLDHRVMCMLPFRGGTYRDSTLITCAEYQVFLNEKRNLGQSHQPDHWPAPQFASEQASYAVLGVRPADAQAFCEWLTRRRRRRGETWTFRLPTPEEIPSLELDSEHAAGGWARGYSYWTFAPKDKVFGWVNLQGAPSPSMSLVTLEARLDHDLKRMAEVVAAAYGLANTLRPDLKKAWEARPVSALDLSRSLERARSHSLALAQIQAQLLARESPPDRMGNLGQGENPEHDRALALVGELARARASADALNFAFMLSRTHDHTLAQVLNRDPAAAPGQHVAQAKASEDLRWYIRIFALTIAAEFSRQLNVQNTFHAEQAQKLPGSSNQQINTQLQGAIDAYLDLYIHFALLEERIQGRIPAFEGILLVRERATDNDMSKTVFLNL